MSPIAKLIPFLLLILFVVYMNSGDTSEGSTAAPSEPDYKTYGLTATHGALTTPDAFAGHCMRAFNDAGKTFNPGLPDVRRSNVGPQEGCHCMADRLYKADFRGSEFRFAKGVLDGLLSAGTAPLTAVSEKAGGARGYSKSRSMTLGRKVMAAFKQCPEPSDAVKALRRTHNYSQ